MQTLKWREKLFKASGVLFIGSLIVKIIAVLKESLLAKYYGTLPDLDAYLTAMIIPFFFQYVNQTSISSALVPEFTKVIKKEGISSATSFFWSSLRALTLLYLSFLVLFILIRDPFIQLLAPHHNSEQILLIQRLYLTCIPAVVLTALSYFLGGVLNSFENFKAPAFIGITIPVSICASALFFHDLGIQPIAIGTLIGYSTEFLLLLIIVVKKLGFSKHLVPLRSTLVLLKSYTTPIAAAVLLGAANIYDQWTANSLGPQNISTFNYGIKVSNSLIVLLSAIWIAILPFFSQIIVDESHERLRKTFTKVNSLTFAATIPITLVLTLYSHEIIHILFERGAFTSYDTEAVSKVQAYYFLQIPFFVTSMVHFKYLSAINKNHIFLVYASLFLTLKLVLNIYLSEKIGVSGIALATTITSFISYLYLFFHFLRPEKSGK